jgi:hypothetical protein
LLQEALLALMMTWYIPAAVIAGVPEIRPVDVFTDKPTGSPLAL